MKRIIQCICILAITAGTTMAQAYLVVMAKNCRIFEKMEQEKLVYHNDETQAFLLKLHNTGYGTTGDCSRFEIDLDGGEFKLAVAAGSPGYTDRFLFTENVMCLHAQTGASRSYLLSKDFRSINLTAKTGKLKDGQMVAMETELTACIDSGGTGRKLEMVQHWTIDQDDPFTGAKAGTYKGPAFILDEIQPGILFIGEIPEENILKIWEPTPYPCLFRRK